MNNKTDQKKLYNFNASELKTLTITKDQKPKIKIHDGNGNSTKHISLTARQYKLIKNILIN